MELLGRLPHALALGAPLALALLGRDTVARARPVAPAAEDTVVAWRADMRPPMGQLYRDTVEKHGGSASGRFVASPQGASIVNSEGRGGRPGTPRMRPVHFAQALNAEPYRGRRVRLSLWVRTRLPEKPAPKMPVSQVNVFMRIENGDGTYGLYDGNIAPIFGNTEWARKFVVMEVAPDAYAISFGVAVTGPGEVWVDDVLFEDQGEAMGNYDRKPMIPPERLAQMTAEQLERGKEMLAQAMERMKTRPVEVVNGDFETR